MENGSKIKQQSAEIKSRHFHLNENPADIYLFKANNGNTSTMCKFCCNLTANIPERRQ